ncbi:hypothetical protein HDU93_003912 [Gonapodya sp. JEL0774]|nr:hypothetical protein HDU93_003912 [Gonapodya sp. JEL0774]
MASYSDRSLVPARFVSRACGEAESSPGVPVTGWGGIPVNWSQSMRPTARHASIDVTSGSQRLSESAGCSSSGRSLGPQTSIANPVVAINERGILGLWPPPNTRPKSTIKFREPPGLSFGLDGTLPDSSEHVAQLAETRRKLVASNKVSEIANARLEETITELVKVQEVSDIFRHLLIAATTREWEGAETMVAIERERFWAIAKLRAMLDVTNGMSREIASLKSELAASRRAAEVETQDLRHEVTLLKSSLAAARMVINEKDDRVLIAERVIGDQRKGIAGLKAKLRGARRMVAAGKTKRETLVPPATPVAVISPNDGTPSTTTIFNEGQLGFNLPGQLLQRHQEESPRESIMKRKALVNGAVNKVRGLWSRLRTRMPAHRRSLLSVDRKTTHKALDAVRPATHWTPQSLSPTPFAPKHGGLSLGPNGPVLNSSQLLALHEDTCKKLVAAKKESEISTAQLDETLTESMKLEEVSEIFHGLLVAAMTCAQENADRMAAIDGERFWAVTKLRQLLEVSDEMSREIASLKSDLAGSSRAAAVEKEGL